MVETLFSRRLHAWRRPRRTFSSAVERVGSGGTTHRWRSIRRSRASP